MKPMPGTYCFAFAEDSKITRIGGRGFGFLAEQIHSFAICEGVETQMIRHIANHGRLEFTQNLPIALVMEPVVCPSVHVLTDESHRSITKQELRSACVKTECIVVVDG